MSRQLCSHTLFNVSELWNSSPPVVSDCLQLSLLCVPCLFLWVSILIALIHVACTRRSSQHNIHISNFEWSVLLKSFLVTLIGMCCVIDLVFLAMNDAKENFDMIYYITSSLLLSSMLISLILTLTSIYKVVSPEILVFFWILIVVATIPRLYQLIQDAIAGVGIGLGTRFYTFMIFGGLSFLEFCLIAFTKIAPDSIDPNDPNPCPELKATFLSRLIYAWLDKTVYHTYKGLTTEESVFNLRPNHTVEHNVAGFIKKWNEEKVIADKKNAVLQRQKSQAAMYSPTIATSDTAPILSNVQENEEDIAIDNFNVNIIQPSSNTDGHASGAAAAGGSGTEEEKEKDDGRAYPNLYKVLYSVFGSSFLLSWISKLIYDLLNYLNPFLLKWLLDYIHNVDEPQWHGYVYAVLFFLVQIVGSILINLCFHIAVGASLRMRSGIVSAIYSKTLVLTHEARAKSTIGEIVNLMSVDADRITDTSIFLWIIWSSLLQFGVGLGILYWELGPSVFVGIAVLIALVPVNGVIMSLLQTYEENEMKWKDKRIKMLTDILNGIKVLKLYAWELSYQNKVTKIRDTELGYSKRVNYGWATVIVIWDMVPFLITLTTFLVFVYTGDDHVLTAQKAFVSLTLFNMIRAPMIMLPWGITSIINAHVSVKRIRRFLYEDEIDMTGICHEPTQPEGSDIVIEVKEGDFSWRSEATPTLKNIDMEIRRAKLVAVVGKVGVGKSSLMSAILGEMHRRQGNVTVKGRIAYVSQEAWIQNLSLRENILFGEKWNEEWYNQVVEACALNADLELLPAGDATEIGERGINLSGGQKQRVSLARAVYQNADVYLLDDPLSAVDAHVGKHIFDHVVGPKGLLKTKTRILVTHGIHWLPDVDYVLVLDIQGRIAERGTYQELLDSEQAFADFLRTYLTQLEDKEAAVEPDSTKSGSSASQTIPPTSRSRSITDKSETTPIRAGDLVLRLASHISQTEEDKTSSLSPSTPKSEAVAMWRPKSPSNADESHIASSLGTSPHSRPAGLSRRISQISNADFVEDIPPAVQRRTSCVAQPTTEPSTSTAAATFTDGKLIEDEGQAVGRVSWKAYVVYIVGRGIGLTLITLLAYAAFSVMQVFSNLWLTKFTEDPFLLNCSNAIASGHNISRADRDKMHQYTNYYMGIYGAFGAGETVAVALYAFVQAVGIIKASKIIHLNLLNRLMRAPMSFFDTTPLGRILNRFSKDIEAVDHSLPSAFNDLISCMAPVLSSIIVICTTTPNFNYMLVPLIVIYCFIQAFSIPISRESRRLDSVTRSPIYTQFAEVIAGTSIIRAFGQQSRFSHMSNASINKNARFYYLKMTANRWLAVRLEMLSGVVVFGAILFAVLDRSTLSAALVGLSVTYALSITENLNWLVRQLTEIETNAVSLERIKEYTEVVQEAAWIKNDVQVSPDWPSIGAIEFLNYSTRYREGLPLVIKDISVRILGGHKIGIVGRTGAGKSSLTLALFRLIEASEGSIEIDGIPLDQLGLHQLRSRITILPQDPVLFSGSLRGNLDPLNLHSDVDIWTALDQAHLGDWARGLENQADPLEYEVGESGCNLSVGQRQLVCLSRALLRRPGGDGGVLVLDEATAGVDLDTDQLVMDTIRERFPRFTVIIIAHRLATVMSTDKIVVLDQGKIAEFDSPAELLKNESGIFYSMAKNAGLV